MAKKLISGLLIFVWTVSLFLHPSAAQADYWQELALDRDGDGLPDAVETAGWRNAAGGPFGTNPLDPDSDDDGLTDGEEKFFDTHPLNKNSPGIWVEYQSGFKTREYFHGSNNAEPTEDGGGPNPQTLQGGYLHWEEGGARRLMTEGVVVRRGTSFSLGGPPGATLSITKYNPSQTDLSFTTSATCIGGWNVTVDPNETVGIYTATLTLGAWSDTLPIYVIFELPTPHNGSGINKITQADIDAFVYNDDPTNLKDELAIWWNLRDTDYNHPCGPNSGPCDDEPYHRSRGFHQGFPTDQFKKYIFRDRVMPVVSGAADQTTALNRIANKADTEIRVNFGNIKNTMFDALRRYHDKGTVDKYSQAGSACDTNASVFTGFARSTGLMIKPFIVDWNTETVGSNNHHGESTSSGLTDTSALAWLNNEWKGVRSYAKNESVEGDNTYKHYPFNGGIKNIGPLFKWYSDNTGDIMITSNGNYNIAQVNMTLDHRAEFTATLFGLKWDYWWDSRSPLYIQREPGIDTLTVPVWRGDPFKPNDFGPAVYVLPSPYPGGDLNENWPVEPDPTGCSPETSPPYANCPYSGVGDGMGSLETELEALPTPEPIKTAAFDQTYSHKAIDTNGDGKADALVVELGLTIVKPGTFSAEAELYDARGEWIGRTTWQGPGPKVRLQFNNVAGRPAPYTLRYVYLSDGPGSTADVWGDIKLAPLTELNGGPARLGTLPGGISGKGLTITPTLSFSHSTPDADSDGKRDALVVNAGMTVSQAGNYRLEGWLVAANGKLVAWAQSAPATLPVGTSNLSLRFEGRAINDRALPGPYTLQELKVLDGNTGTFNVLDEVQQTGLSLNYQPSQFETTALFQDNMEDGTSGWSAGSIWSLVSNTAFSPTQSWRAQAGSSEAGNLTSPSINAQNHASPVLRFQSCAELSGTTNNTVEISTNNGNSWTPVATYTQAIPPWTTYAVSLENFEKQGNLKVRFRAETGGGTSLKWYVDDVRLNAWPAINNVSITRTPPGPVTPITRTFTFTANHSTIDTSVPISYIWKIDDGVVPGAVNRTLVYTFTENPPEEHTVEVIVSNPYDEGTAAQLLGSGDPVTGANFTYSPTTPQVVGTTINFTGTHQPANATNNGSFPLTYQWDFGDGGAATGPTPSHSYTASGNYSVKLTVSNGLGTAITSTVVSVKEALTAVAFNASSEAGVLREGEPVTFNAVYTPSTASQPINYTWNFKDGSGNQLTTSPSLTHTFANWGTYAVVVTATNGYGPPVSFTANVVIDGQPVTAGDFTVVEGSNGMEGLFTVSYLPANATQSISYTWRFPGPVVVTKTSPTITHTFSGEGTFDVELTLSNGFGSPVLITKTITVPFDDDGDGLSNKLEDQLGTDRNNPDSDGDGLEDGFEVNGYLYTGYASHPDFNQTITPDPTNPDSDGDGVSDGEEYSQGTHPLDDDTDGDTLTDGQEYDPGNSPRTSPLSLDTDNDGIPDKTEVGPNPDSPRNTDGDTLIDGIDPDSDNDGIPDAAEWDKDQKASTADDLCSNKNVDVDNDGIPNCQDNDVDGDGLHNYRDTDSDGDVTPDKTEGTGDEDGDGIPNFLDRLDLNGDNDGDGLSNGQEIALGTNPQSSDSDGDGIPDKTEVGSNVNAPLNTDGDSLIDALDPDSDNDGILDAAEWDTDQKASTADDLCGNKGLDSDGDGIPNCQDNDVDGDSIPNYRDTDSDGDGLVDKAEGTGDKDNDGIPNFLDRDIVKTFLPLIKK